MKGIWREVARRVTERLVQADRERVIRLLRARVTKHHPILTMHIDDVEALIKGSRQTYNETAVVLTGEQK